jgi:hypothetical protein
MPETSAGSNSPIMVAGPGRRRGGCDTSLIVGEKLSAETTVLRSFLNADESDG